MEINVIYRPMQEQQRAEMVQIDNFITAEQAAGFPSSHMYRDMATAALQRAIEDEADFSSLPAYVAEVAASHNAYSVNELSLTETAIVNRMAQRGYLNLFLGN